MMSTVVISKSSSQIVVVRRPSSEPSSTTSNGTTIKLSPLDRGNFPMSVLLLHEHPINNNTNTNTTNTVRTALSKALVHYYPFSGRFVPGGGDGGSTGPYIDCTGEGTVEFITASADCSLKQASKLFERRSPSSSSSSDGGGTGTGTGAGTSSLLDELIGYYPTGGYGATDPLLSVQLTEFTCGGFVLGVTWSHAVADGIGIAQFLGAVGELARGQTASPSILPVRWDEAVSSLPPPPGLLQDVIAASLAAHGHSYQKMLEACPLVALDVTIPSSFIGRVKLRAAHSELFHGQPRCTTFEVAAAILWRCRTRATMSESSSSPDTLSVLSFTANVRKHVGARDGYYGNCVVTQVVAPTSGTVAGADIVDLVKMIRQAKDEVPSLLDEKRDESSTKKRMERLGGRYNVLMVTSWRNIGFEGVDFGSGPPARVMWHEPGMPPFPICLLCPSKKDGVSVVSFCVKEEHANAFLKEIAKFTS